MKKGFSIIELLVAFFILTTGILVIYSTAVLPLRHTGEVGQKITAFYLAQEGVEIVTHMRNNFEEWGEGLPGKEECFAIDYKGREEGCDNSDLFFDDDDDGYNHGSGSPTDFQRTINILEKNEDLLKIEVIVSWGEEDNEKIVVYKDFHNYLNIQYEE